MDTIQTPSQTVGPFFHYGLIFNGEDDLLKDGVKGDRITLIGSVFDANGEAIPDAMIEIWQADSIGIYPHPSDSRQNEADPNFRGFGRSDTTRDQLFRFSTIKPGKTLYQDGSAKQAPHINLRVLGRGLLVHLQTRVYFDDEAEENEQDPIFRSLDPERRSTLVAKKDGYMGNTTIYRFDIVLQGEQETLFFQP
jgi:protocatechuate 3,4-dioxygenase alpha subunit